MLFVDYTKRLNLLIGTREVPRYLLVFTYNISGLYNIKEKETFRDAREYAWHRYLAKKKDNSIVSLRK